MHEKILIAIGPLQWIRPFKANASRAAIVAVVIEKGYRGLGPGQAQIGGLLRLLYDCCACYTEEE